MTGRLSSQRCDLLAVAVIPARYTSRRFPGKPLANETGKYLIQHVYERVCQARSIQQVIVATDDERIRLAAESFGARAIMTGAEHACGTDRAAEVAGSLPGEVEVIVNVQGDEPEIEPDYIDRLVGLLEQDRQCSMATLACPFGPQMDPTDPNRVKVVLDDAGRALYFSRSLIPYPRDQAGRVSRPSDYLLHLGIYAYRRECLLDYPAWAPGRLEQIEHLEQLRALEHGVKIAVGLVERATIGIDTPDDYAAFVRRVRAASSGQT
ncbi:MAG: 3-deoxy-manno-octulosonate cytidylyltransferase [Phycisphaerae bacterium]